MIVEDQNMSDCFAPYGDRSRQDREDFLRSSRCCIRQYVGSKIHHSFLNTSSADISENVENLQTADPPTHEATARQVTRMTGKNADHSQFWCLLTGPAESKPNSRMIKTSISGVMLMTCSGHRQKIATAPKPSRTPSSGLETANQKEIFQSGTLTVEFVFTLFSQAFEDRYFTKFEELLNRGYRG